MCTSCFQQVSSCFPELWQPLASWGSIEDTNGSCPAEASHRVQQIACKNVSVSGSLDCLGQRGLGAGTACLLSPCISPMVSRGKDTYLLRCNPGCSTSCAPWGLCEGGWRETWGPRETESRVVGAWWLMPPPLSAPWPQLSPSAEVPPWVLAEAWHVGFSACVEKSMLKNWNSSELSFWQDACVQCPEPDCFSYARGHWRMLIF